MNELSAVIAHYGRVDLTAAIVSDLQSQVGTQVEVIVSDDASPHPFPDVPGITVVRSTDNGGYGTAINRGAQRAQSPWLLILNSDVRIPANFTREALLRAAHRAPAVFGFRHQSISGPVPSASPLPTIPGTLGQHCDTIQPLARKFGWDAAWRWLDPNDDSIRQVGWVSGAAMLIPTHNFLQAGGFDERYYMYSEEVDLQRRLRDQGVPAVLLGDLVVEHRGGASTTSLDRQVEQLRSRLLYEEIWRGKGHRRFIETGLRSVLFIDSLYQRIRQIIDGDETRGKNIARRRRVYSEAFKVRPSRRVDL